MSPRDQTGDETLEAPERRPPSVTMPATLIGEPWARAPEEVAPDVRRYSEIALLGEGGWGRCTCVATSASVARWR